jgi:UDP-N-acetylmuramoyl-tripeptide--D-alanyl-D-alanine ligase
LSDEAGVVFRADELAVVAGGRLESGRTDIELGRFAIDSRRVRPGDMFVAIRGDRFDGHRFVAEAFGKGAVGAIVADASAIPAAEAGAHVSVVVDDTVAALQRIARAVRRRSGARVVAITGSVGKTTTKELTAALLETRYRVLRNEGNLNNHIGLPLSLLELRRRPEVAVVELGMNHAGEIRALVGFAEPEFRVWTNVAEVHAAFFDSVEAIADAKAEILEGATSATELVVNAADERAMARVGGFPGRTTTFGVTDTADVRASDVTDLGLDGTRSRLETPAGRGMLRSRLVGAGHVANALAAIAVALRFQVPLETILATVATFEARHRRGEVARLSHGVTVVDDSYNSSPAALMSTLRSVGVDRAHGRRVAVLGEMLELGDRAEALHRACGVAAVEAGFERIVAIGGASAEALAAGARAGGLPAAAVTTWTTSADAAPAVSDLVRAGDLVLVKGSRGVGTERIVDRLRADWA